ncbi:hypothetical protein Tco_0051645 [Tanacetum coccineum]
MTMLLQFHGLASSFSFYEGKWISQKLLLASYYNLARKSYLISETISLNRCELCRSYDHDNHGHNRIIFLRRGIKPRNLQHVTKNCETCGSNVHTTSDHNDIEWFKKKEVLQAKKADSFKANKTESSSALRSKTLKKSETPMVPPNKLGPDLNGKAINETQYRGMIGSLMYLTASRSDIQFSTCLYVKYQANLKESYLIAVKGIFRKTTSVKAEYVAPARCCANILWMKS